MNGGRGFSFLDRDGVEVFVRVEARFVDDNSNEEAHRTFLPLLMNGYGGIAPPHVVVGGHPAFALFDGQVATDASRLFIDCCTASSRLFSKLSSPLAFGMQEPSEHAADRYLHGLLERGVRRIAIVFAGNDPLTRSMCVGAYDRAQELGFEVPVYQSYYHFPNAEDLGYTWTWGSGLGEGVPTEPSAAELSTSWGRATDKMLLTSLTDHIASEQLEHVLLCSFAEDAAFVLNSLDKSRFIVQSAFASPGAEEGSFLDAANPFVGEYVFSAQSWQPTVVESDPIFNDTDVFRVRFERAFGRAPTALAVHAAAAGTVLLQSIAASLRDCAIALSNLSSLEDILFTGPTATLRPSGGVSLAPLHCRSNASLVVPQSGLERWVRTLQNLDMSTLGGLVRFGRNQVNEAASTVLNQLRYRLKSGELADMATPTDLDSLSPLEQVTVLPQKYRSPGASLVVPAPGSVFVKVTAPAAIVVNVLAGTILVTTVLTIVFFIFHRQRTVLLDTKALFTLYPLGGLVFLSSWPFLLSGVPTLATCNARYFVVAIGLVGLILPVTVKFHYLRLQREVPTRRTEYRARNTVLNRWMVAALLVVVAVLGFGAAGSMAIPLRGICIRGGEFGYGMWWIVLLVIVALEGYTAFLVVDTRYVPTPFNEGRDLAILVFGHVVVLAIAFPMVIFSSAGVLQLSPTAEALFQGLLAIATVGFSVAALSTTKVTEVLKETNQRRDEEARFIARNVSAHADAVSRLGVLSTDLAPPALAQVASSIADDSAESAVAVNFDHNPAAKFVHAIQSRRELELAGIRTDAATGRVLHNGGGSSGIGVGLRTKLDLKHESMAQAVVLAGRGTAGQGAGVEAVLHGVKPGEAKAALAPTSATYSTDKPVGGGVGVSIGPDGMRRPVKREADAEVLRKLRHTETLLHRAESENERLREAVVALRGEVELLKAPVRAGIIQEQEAGVDDTEGLEERSASEDESRARSLASSLQSTYRRHARMSQQGPRPPRRPGMSPSSTTRAYNRVDGGPRSLEQSLPANLQHVVDAAVITSSPPRSVLRSPLRARRGGGRRNSAPSAFEVPSEGVYRERSLEPAASRVTDALRDGREAILQPPNATADSARSTSSASPVSRLASALMTTVRKGNLAVRQFFGFDEEEEALVARVGRREATRILTGAGTNAAGTGASIERSEPDRLERAPAPEEGVEMVQALLPLHLQALRDSLEFTRLRQKLTREGLLDGEVLGPRAPRLPAGREDFDSPPVVDAPDSVGTRIQELARSVEDDTLPEDVRRRRQRWLERWRTAVGGVHGPGVRKQEYDAMAEVMQYPMTETLALWEIAHGSGGAALGSSMLSRSAAARSPSASEDARQRDGEYSGGPVRASAVLGVDPFLRHPVESRPWSRTSSRPVSHAALHVSSKVHSLGPTLDPAEHPVIPPGLVPEDLLPQHPELLGPETPAEARSAPPEAIRARIKDEDDALGALGRRARDMDRRKASRKLARALADELERADTSGSP